MNHPMNRNGFRKRFIHALKLTVLLYCLTHAHAQEVLFRQVADTKTDTHVEVTALFSNPSLGGFHPVRVFIANNQRVPHRINLKFESSKVYMTSISTTSNFSFSVDPGKSVTHDILVPLAAQNGYSSSYERFKVSLSGTMRSTEYERSSGFGTNQPNVLLSSTLHAANASALDSEVASRSSSSYSRSSSYYGGTGAFSSRFTPTQLPDDWRAFSGFDSIMMTENDWSDIPPGARNAIISWMRLGGQIVIYTQNSKNANALGLPADTSFGEYQIKSISGDRLDPKPTLDLVYYKSNKNRVAAVTNDFNSVWPLQKELGEKTFSSVLFILILIAFGIIVGPVNLFVFAKSGRRHRLFITTPIISLATSCLLIILIIFQDGFGGEGKRLVLMEVRPDENQNAAFVHQEQFSRTGVMTSPSFSIDTSALFVPVTIESSRWSRFTDQSETTGNYDLQPNSGKLFASGSWFQSRSEQGQLVSAVVPTRGRIEYSKKTDHIVSNFEFPIKTLIFRDKQQYYRAENLTKGKPVALEFITPPDAQIILEELNKKFTNRNRQFFEKVQEREGHFIAITEAAPGIETHPSIDWQTTTIITGPIVR